MTRFLYPLLQVVLIALLLATAAAIVVCVVLGLVVERAAYRPLRHAPRLAPLITAIGVSILIQYSAALVWGKQYLSLPEIVKPGQIEFGGAQITTTTDTAGFIDQTADMVSSAPIKADLKATLANCEINIGRDTGGFPGSEDDTNFTSWGGGQDMKEAQL